MMEQHSLADMNGETRSIRTGQTITLANSDNTTVTLHVRGVSRRWRGTMTVSGDGFTLPLDQYRFAEPSEHPLPGRIRLTDRRSGAWVEGDSLLFRLGPDGVWRTDRGLPSMLADDVTVEGYPSVWFTAVRTFGTTDVDWLASKQLSESRELEAAAFVWSREGTADNRMAMLDELADLLQTVANLCHAAGVSDAEIAGALSDCWAKNMRRELADGGRDAEGRPFRPNEMVFVDGCRARILPSDSWLSRIDGRPLLRVRFDDGMVGLFPPDRLSH